MWCRLWNRMVQVYTLSRIRCVTLGRLVQFFCLHFLICKTDSANLSVLMIVKRANPSKVLKKVPACSKG